MSNNTNKSAALRLIDAYRHILAASATPREITAGSVLHIAAAAINAAHPVLFADDDDLAAAVAGELLRNFRLELHSEPGLRATQDFASVIVRDIYVSAYNRDKAAFAPKSRRLDLLLSALSTVDVDKPVTVTQLAARAGVVRRTVQDAIETGRIPAEKFGNTYAIRADDAAVFIASRRSPE